MRDFLAALFPVALAFFSANVICLIVGLLLHANGQFIRGHKLVAMSGFCKKWVVRNCPYELGDKCPCWNCPRATDRKNPCDVFKIGRLGTPRFLQEVKRSAIARRKPQE